MEQELKSISFDANPIHISTLNNKGNNAIKDCNGISSSVGRCGHYRGLVYLSQHGERDTDKVKRTTVSYNNMVLSTLISRSRFPSLKGTLSVLE